VATLEALQAGVEAALLLVQKAVEQRDRRPQLFILRITSRNLSLSAGPLFLPSNPIGCRVQIERPHRLTIQAPLLDQLTQGIFDRHVQPPVQFVREVARRRLSDHSLGRGQQRALPREPRSAATPEPVLVESDDGVQGVETAAMRVAAAVGQLGQLAEDGLIDLAPQSGLHLGHGHGFEPLEEVPEGLKGISNRVHNVRIPPACHLASVFLTLRRGGAFSQLQVPKPSEH
jgi:hypothetical protein